jgi:predicted molibdopterin-dependent oxidoreductase YjgC
MFRRLGDKGATLTLTVDGQEIRARIGDTVAAAMLAAGIGRFRTTPVSGAARAPYCMMGVCFDCLVTIDGAPNQQGCMIALRDGMKIERQHGARDVG